AQDLLFERIQTLAAAGSRIAVGAMGPDFNKPEARERRRSQTRRYRELAARLGREQPEIPDFEELWYFEDRADVGDWLRGHGWEVSVQTAEEVMARYDRHPPEGIEDGAPSSLYVSGER
ncbi:MAG: SAM-dependent methyltransferase, partial [Mycobacterium sp.]